MRISDLPETPIGMFIMAAVIALAFVAILYVSFCYSGKNFQDLIEAYQVNLRGNFFTGFLTIGSFLLSLKTFIVVKLKEGVYDSKSYRQRFKEQTVGQDDADIYAPLKNISHLLFGTILAAITTAVLHVTLGLVDYWWALLICVFFVVFSIILLIISLILIKQNIITWLSPQSD